MRIIALVGALALSAGVVAYRIKQQRVSQQ